MEFISGISLKQIFADHWDKIPDKFGNRLRFAIIRNVDKILSCKTEVLGFHLYVCPRCHHIIKVPHSCKSRFCSSCGKKAVDNWIANNLKILPKTTWQHITFTMPSELWNLFWLNRKLFNLIPALAANIIKSIAKKKNATPGIFVVPHTFGRTLNKNVHLHLSTTTGGLSPQNKWIKNIYFKHDILKEKWKYAIISLFRKQYKLGNIKLPKKLGHIKNYTAFNSWLNFLYQKKWVVYLKKSSDNHRINVEYLGKYLKRPPIGETRIKKYDGNFVTFEFLDHHDNTKKTMSLPVLDFITRLISHIPDVNFKCIRYFGFLANRVRSKLLPLVYKLLNIDANKIKKFYLSWRYLISSAFHYDPLLCPKCHNTLCLVEIVNPPKRISFKN